jgi:hypothetical protein
VSVPIVVRVIQFEIVPRGVTRLVLHLLDVPVDAALVLADAVVQELVGEFLKIFIYSVFDCLSEWI